MYTLWCLVFGETDAFPVEINEARSVAELKTVIKNEKTNTFKDFDANNLTLYKLTSDVDENQSEMEDITNKRFDLKKQALKPMNKLANILSDTANLENIVHILVVPPQSPVRVFQWNRLDSSDYRDHTVARICQLFWGKQDISLDFESKKTIFINSEELREAHGVLYVFRQYSYLQKRIDKFRVEAEKYRKSISKGYPTHTLAPEKASVVITGTPGTGKTTFLHFYLIWELAQKKPVVYWALGQLYIIAGEDEIYSSIATDGFVIDKKYWDAVCFIDSDALNPPPRSLTNNRELFILQAASPNPKHTEWMKPRTRAVKFVLNPPETPEIITALQIHEPALDKTKIETAVATYGVNMRSLRSILMQDDEEGVVAKITQKIRALSLMEIRSMLSTEFETTEQTSHSIIMTLCPKQPQSDADDKYLHGDIGKRTLSCPLVFKLLVQRHGMAFYEEARHLARLFAKVPQTTSSAGWLWEQQCHLGIPSLRHIDLIPMTVNNNKLVPATAEKHERVMIDTPIPEIYTKKDTMESTLDSTKYWIPFTSNNPTFDAFFRSGPKGIGLQMTLGTDHSLVTSGLNDLKNRLSTTKAKDRYFVFVIPKGQVFSCTKPADEWLSDFTFFILEMELDEPPFEAAVSISQKRKRPDVTVDGSPQINKRLRVRDPDGEEDESDNERGGSDDRPTTRGKMKKNQRQPKTISAKQPPRRGKMRAAKNR